MTDGARFLREKKLAARIWAKTGPKTSFFLPFSQVWCISFLELADNDNLQRCLTSNTDKYTKKIYGPKFGSKVPKLVLKLGFCHFLKFGSLDFLEIAYNDSLEQCLNTSRGKTGKKKYGA